MAKKLLTHRDEWNDQPVIPERNSCEPTSVVCDELRFLGIEYSTTVPRSPFHSSFEIPCTIIAKKRVHFVVDQSGRLKVQVFGHKQDDEERTYGTEYLYYTQENLRENQKANRADAKTYIKRNEEYRQCLKGIMEGKVRCERQDAVELIVRASASGMRGLETSMMTNMFRAQRKTAVLSVLELQQMMKGMSCYLTKVQQQAMLEMGLRAKSTEVSRSSRNLALIFAEADARAIDLEI